MARPKHLARQKYSKDEQAEILSVVAEQRNSLYRAAKASGISKSVIDKIVKRQECVSAALRPYSREHHQKLLEDRVVGTLEAIDPAEAKDAFHLSYAHKNLNYDLNLIQGKPTDITAHLHAHRHDIHDLGKKLATALELIDRARGSEPVDHQDEPPDEA